MRLQKFRVKKISLRITLYFTSLLLLVALVITILNVTLYQREVTEQMNNVTTQKLSLITGELNASIENIRQIHSVLLNDDAVRNRFMATVDNPSAENIQQLASLLENKAKGNTIAKYIIPIGLDGTIYDPISNFPAYQQLTQGNTDFQIASDKSQYLRFSVPNTFPLEYTSPTMVQRKNITLYAQYFDYEQVKQIGYIAINFDKVGLLGDIEQLAVETFSSLYIMDDQGELIHQIGDIPFDEVPLTLSDGDALKLNDKTYTFRTRSLNSYNRWQIISLFDTDIIRSTTYQLNKYVYFTMAAAMILMIFISWFISQSITNPIRTLITSMSEFEHGQWPEPLTTRNEDEIKDLIEGYNAMLANTIRLTDNIIGRQQEKQMIELDLVKTQLHLLEAQINPHFIHNTLNSMNYLALVKGNQELSTIIESFNKLLRMSMAIDISFVTVAQEIENIKAYAQIQSVRFENAFIIDYVVDSEAMISKIPKLILQPIVENAIIHGILPKDEQGHILLAIRKKAEMLMIIITDDGIGIPEAQLNAIVNTAKIGGITKRIGVQNVFDRLKMYYGDNINVTMKSTQGVGTTTIIMIPYED